MSRKEIADLGRFVAAARAERSLSYRALAAQTRGAVSAPTVLRIENGTPVSYEHLSATLKALGFSLVVVVGDRPPVARVE